MSETNNLLRLEELQGPSESHLGDIVEVGNRDVATAIDMKDGPPFSGVWSIGDTHSRMDDLIDAVRDLQ